MAFYVNITKNMRFKMIDILHHLSMPYLDNKLLRITNRYLLPWYKLNRILCDKVQRHKKNARVSLIIF